MKNLFALMSFILSFTYGSYCQDFRDSIDVIHYDISVSFKNLDNKNIETTTKIKFLCKFDKMKYLKFDLKDFKVEKIVLNRYSIKNWTHKNDILSFQSPRNLNNRDTNQLIISFWGTPQEDERWGGFYFKNKSAFNMGIAMASSPPSAGRYWFACSDNFKDKATFNYTITVANGFWASAGGILVSVNQAKDYTTFEWKQTSYIPPYLASIAVANYDTINDTYINIKGKKIPIVIFTYKNKKQLSKQSFVNLNKALEAFEQMFGEYRFDKVGFSEINFDGGAMEHAENISVSTYAFNGNTSKELLFYHELAHSWFGNLVTCSTTKDMWLNEAWATYCEALFGEKVYGFEHYKNIARERHFYALNFAHLNDDGYKIIADIDFNNTYGTTIYKKGADLVQALRNYVGDSAFFSTTQQFLNTFAFGNASIDDFENFWLLKTKDKNLSYFFDYWLHSAGYPFYELQNYSVAKQKDDYLIDLNIKTLAVTGNVKPKMNKLEIALIDSNLNINYIPIVVWDSIAKYSIKTDKKPALVCLDLEEKMPDATLDRYYITKDTGLLIFDESFCDVYVSKISDNSLIRIICNFVSPSDTNLDNYLFQSAYYWTVEGVWNNNFEAYGRFYLTKLMDNYFVKKVKPHQIVLMYRPTAQDKWQELDYSFKYEYLETNLKQGQYALAIRK